jgi:hypothetical protein
MHLLRPHGFYVAMTFIPICAKHVCSLAASRLAMCNGTYGPLLWNVCVMMRERSGAERNVLFVVLHDV